MANSTSLTGLSKDILREKYILEGFKLYLEATDPNYFKLLIESDNSDTLLENKFLDFFNKIKDGVQKTRIADIFKGIALFSKSIPELPGLVPKIAQEIIDNKISPKQIPSLLNKFRKEKNTNEATNTAPGSGNYTSDSDAVNFPALVQVSQSPVAEKLWQKLIILVVAIGFFAKMFTAGQANKEVVQQATQAGTEQVIQQSQNLDSDPDGNNLSWEQAQKALSDLEKNKVEVPGAEEEGAKVEDKDGEIKTKVTKHLAAKSPYGKGTTFDPEGEKIINGTIEKIVDELKAGNKVKIQAAGTVSNTTGDDEKATDTNKQLTQSRADDFKAKVLAGLEKSGLTEEQLKNFTIEILKADPSSNQVQEPKGGDGASGVFITFTTEGGKEYKLSWDGWPEWGAWGVIDFLNPEGGDETPKPDGDKTNITPIPPVEGDDFSKLNRNGQIATVLASIDPKLNIAQYKEIGPIKSYTDNELLNPNIKNAKAKELARLIVTIRKNPNSLLKKVSGATGIPFNIRAKAISTRASKSTQAQLQSPTVKETQELFQEALVDDIFTKLGIQDSDLAKNKIKLAGYLGSMYAKEGDTDLSILDTDKLSDDDKKELQKVGFGFTPQSGNNYVFLKGQTKNQVKNQAKVQADTTRVLNTINRNTSLKTSLKRINTKDELKELIKAIIGYINDRLKQTPSQIKTDLTTIRNQYKAPNKPLKEEEKALNLPDINNAVKIIDSYAGLKTDLDRINTREELIQFLRGLITFLDPALISREADIKAAFQGASNSMTNKALTPGAKKPTAEIQRMQELAGLK